MIMEIRNIKYFGCCSTSRWSKVFVGADIAVVEKP